MKVIEGEGGGIGEVFRSLKARGLPEPLLRDTGVQFTATLWRQPGSDAPTSDTERQQRPQPSVRDDGIQLPSDAPLLQIRSSKPTKNEPVVLDCVQRFPQGVSLAQIAELTGLGVPQIRYALARPIDEKLVVIDGKKGVKATTYRLAT